MQNRPPTIENRSTGVARHRPVVGCRFPIFHSFLLPHSRLPPLALCYVLCYVAINVTTESAARTEGDFMRKTTRQPVEIARRIVVDPRVRFGQPVIKGTRVPVSVLLDELAAGSAFESIANEYSVTQEDIRAAIRFAAQR